MQCKFFVAPPHLHTPSVSHLCPCPHPHCMPSGARQFKVTKKTQKQDINNRHSKLTLCTLPLTLIHHLLLSHHLTFPLSVLYLCAPCLYHLTCPPSLAPSLHCLIHPLLPYPPTLST